MKPIKKSILKASAITLGLFLIVFILVELYGLTCKGEFINVFTTNGGVPMSCAQAIFFILVLFIPLIAIISNVIYDYEKK